MIRFQVSGIVERNGGTELSYRLLKGTMKHGEFNATECVYQDTVSLGHAKPEKYPALFKGLVQRWMQKHGEDTVHGL